MIPLESCEVATKEHPILFTGVMVRAIIDDRKTQTRRAMKTFLHRYAWGEAESLMDIDRMPCFVSMGGVEYLCPYGQPGDQLWVREAWVPLWHGSYEPLDHIPKSDSMYHFVRYAEEDPFSTLSAGDRGYKYRPSIHMPRWASRIVCEIVDVRVERVQEISEADAIAEGIQFDEDSGYWFAGDAAMGVTAVGTYRQLWDSINAKRGFPWDADPWVWVIDFRRSSN